MIGKVAEIETISDKDVLIHNNLRMVALTSASMIIKECEKWHPNGEGTNFPSGDSVLSYLNKNMNWANHGFTNALQTHVEIVYALVEALSKNPNQKFWVEIGEAIFLTKSLEVYQGWKEHVIKREKAIHGEPWGDATGFNQAKWNENNQKLLYLYKKKE